MISKIAPLDRRSGLNDFVRGDPYFKALGNRVELNRCPSCNVGMIVSCPTLRECPKCKYNDSSNVPFKFKLTFNILHNPDEKEVVVEAKEIPSGKLSFSLPFQDHFAAERYVDMMQECRIL